MSKTNQTLRDVFHKNGLNYSQIVGEENTVVSMGLEGFNQALKEISELLVECSDVESISKNETFLEGYATAKDEIKANLLEALQ